MQLLLLALLSATPDSCLDDDLLGEDTKLEALARTSLPDAKQARAERIPHGTWSAEMLIVLRPEADTAAVVASLELSRRCTARCLGQDTGDTPARIRGGGKTLIWKNLRIDAAVLRAVGTASSR